MKPNAFAEFTVLVNLSSHHRELRPAQRSHGLDTRVQLNSFLNKQRTEAVKLLGI